MGVGGSIWPPIYFLFISLKLVHKITPKHLYFLQGVASLGPLKIVEIDFLKIELINFVSDTTFSFGASLKGLVPNA